MMRVLIVGMTVLMVGYCFTSAFIQSAAICMIRFHSLVGTGMTESRGIRTSSQSENVRSAFIADSVTGLGSLPAGLTSTTLRDLSLGSG